MNEEDVKRKLAAIHATKIYGSYPIKENQSIDEFIMPETVSFSEFLKKSEK